MNVREVSQCSKILEFFHPPEIIADCRIVTYKIVPSGDVDPIEDDILGVLSIFSLASIIEIFPDPRFTQRIPQREPKTDLGSTILNVSILTHLGEFPQHIVGDDAPHTVRNNADIVACKKCPFLSPLESLANL